MFRWAGPLRTGTVSPLGTTPSGRRSAMMSFTLSSSSSIRRAAKHWTWNCAGRQGDGAAAGRLSTSATQRYEARARAWLSSESLRMPSPSVSQMRKTRLRARSQAGCSVLVAGSNSGAIGCSTAL